MQILRRLLTAGLIIGLSGVLSPAATGGLSPLAPSTGIHWGTGTARGPVKCTPADITPDGRVFPEPQVSGTFLTFTDFQCGIGVLEDLNPDRIDVEILGRSASDHPIYNVKVTNEAIPETDKRHLFILNSIHGNEPAGREGAARVIEDMVDARFMATEDFIKETMDRFVVHFTFGNPDGWVNGDFHGHNDAGFATTRTNNGGRDLNRNFPVQGFLRAANGTIDQPEGQAINRLFLRHADTEHDVDDPANRGWYLGTDNHGQQAKPVAASGLQIVGQFDYQKSERLAHFADGIEGAMAEYGVLDILQELNTLTTGRVRPYEWGTLYDILGYSASGSGIDYYNTPGVVDGTGFATEMTASNAPYNFASHPHLLNQMWVDSVRAINYTMMRDAVNPLEYTFPVGGKAAYVFDPAVVTDSDANGFGPGNATIPSNFTGDDPNVDPDFEFESYAVSRMKFFGDLNKYASEPLEALRVPEVLADPTRLNGFDSVVLADNDMPEGSERAAWVTALKDFVESGGNLIVTDAAAPVIADLVDSIQPAHITMQKGNVGFVTFPADRSHPLNQGLRGVASQTYDVIPIGLPDGAGAAPNWRVNTSAWTAAGGTTTATMGGQTAYGELSLGDGRIRFLGALLPQPSEAYFHPYGLQNYAVTYTGYTLLENMLVWSDPSVDPTPTPTETVSPTPTPTESALPEQTHVSMAGRSHGSGQYSDDTLFGARLTDSTGDPIVGAELVYELTGEGSTRTFPATTDADGVASVSPTLEETPGAYQLVVRFTGDETRQSSADTLTFTVEREDSDLDLTVSGNRTLTARLFDPDMTDAGIENRLIDFYADGELIGSGSTDADGVVTIAVPPGYRGANRTFEAVFQGDAFFLGSSDDRPGQRGGGA